MEHRIERLEELAIALNAEIEKAAGALPEIKAELQGLIAARVAELAADAKADAKKDVCAQCEAIRLETVKRIDEHMAAIMAKRQEVCQLAEIEPALKAFAERAAAGVLREFARESDTKLESIKHEFAKVPKFKHEFAVGGAALADAMRGNWDKETTYKRGDIFTFRGSSYLVLRESRGVLPTQQEQKGASPRYAVIAAAGAPGQNGANGLSAQSVGITSSSLTMNTARILGRTTAGSGSIEELPYTGSGSTVVLSDAPTLTRTIFTGAATTPTGNQQGQVGANATAGIQIVGQGSVNDVSIYNRAGTSVIVIPTGTTTVNIASDLVSGGNGSFSGSVTASATTASTSTTTGSGVFGGGVGAAGNVISGGVVRTGAFTAATLPAAATYPGGQAYVTDANATTRQSIVAGGGSNRVMVYSNGTNWLIL